MARRKVPRSVKLGTEKIIADAIAKIRASGNIWAENPAAAFNDSWRRWFEEYFYTGVVRNLDKLPPRKEGDHRANVQRTVAVVDMIKAASQRYHTAMLRAATLPAPPAPAPLPPLRVRTPE